MPSQPDVSSWLTIWTKPRSTIAEIVRANPSYRFFFFCFVYGFVALLQGAQQVSFGEVASSIKIIILAALFGFFIGFISLSISSLLLKWTGSWIGGHGSYKDIRAAVAWSNVPVAVDLILWFFIAALFGSAVFTREFAELIYFQSPAGRLLLGIGILRFILSAWSLVILLIGLSEVQGFSVFKAVLNTLFALVIVVVVVWIGSFTAWWLQGFLQR